jgi:hypothetical protein
VPGRQRQLVIREPDDTGPDIGFDEIHRRRPDERRDEQVGRMPEQRLWCVHLVQHGVTQHRDAPAQRHRLDLVVSTDTAGALAFTTLSIVPALIFFLFAERRIVGGLSGALNG